MSNFYRNTIDIVVGSTASPPIIQYITENLTCFTENGTDIFNIVPTYDPTYSSDFGGTIGIDEKPNTIGYSFQGTDTSTWSIAPYIDSTTVASFTQSNLPSWCKNIRVVTIGSGGGGGTINTNVNHDHYNNQNKQTDRAFDHSNQQENNGGQRDGAQVQPTQLHPSIHQNTGGQHHGRDHTGQNQAQDAYHYNDHVHDNINAATSGGGGGAGIYLTSISTQTYSQIQIQTTQGTVLSLSNGTTYTITAGGGSGMTAGTVTSQGFEIQGSQISGPVQGYGYTGNPGSQQSGGQNGINNSGDDFSTILTYGDGILGASGNPGYYRVYFLTN